MKKKIALLFGGRSDEHDVSLRSAAFVLSALRKTEHDIYPLGIDRDGGLYHYYGSPKGLLGSWKRDAARIHAVYFGNSSLELREAEQHPYTPDLVFPCLHGGYGENGALVGALMLAGISFVGCSLLSSAIGADKAIAKTLVAQSGIPTVPALLLRPHDPLPTGLSYPLFVKPCTGGSSVGAHIVRDDGALALAVRDARQYSADVLVEHYIQGTELEVAILEGQDGTLTISPPGEIRVADGFYDYDTKYKTNGALLSLPAALDADVEACVLQMARDIFRILRCRGLCRVDFLRAEDGSVYFNEINTMPGFTEISMFPRLLSLIGVDAVRRLVDES